MSGDGLAAFRMSLIRRCQPGPEARTFASPSASSRTVVETFVTSPLSLPRSTTASAIGSLPSSPEVVSRKLSRRAA